MGLISIIAPVDCIEKPMDMEDKKKMHIRVIVCIVFCFVYIREKATMCRTSISCRVRVSYINYRINTKIF